MPIVNTKGKLIKNLLNKGKSKEFPVEIEKYALNTLNALDSAKTIVDVRNLKGWHLLKGDRKGQHSLIIKDRHQWRICFTWKEGTGAIDVEIVDYH